MTHSHFRRSATGFAKKGTKSVGVQRQYSGTLGRVDNCQIATFLSYVTRARDRVLIDRRLYLPENSWVDDPVRRAEAGVPSSVTFKTRPQQVQEMIEAARAAGEDRKVTDLEAELATKKLWLDSARGGLGR